MLFLGVDGGQSHTEALVADETGRVIGRGLGGPTVGADFVGGDEFEKSIREAVCNALGGSTIPAFHSAFFGLTGEFRESKKSRISTFITAQHLTVEHDSVSALFGAFTGMPGIIVIAGTGSVVFGRNEKGETARAGGMGYLFSDEGSGFGTALQAIRLALLERDGLIENHGLHELVCKHFAVASIDEVILGFYGGKMRRDTIAGFAKSVQDAATQGSIVLEAILNKGAGDLADKTRAVQARLGIGDLVAVAGIGGMFCGELFKRLFIDNLLERLPKAEFRAPDFGPGVGALLSAYEQTGVEINRNLLDNLQESLR